ncbi:MAG: lytic murein transglycosylase [Desulfovibrio sp.]|nr:lytic murein transglycosylase [Desulfovibrio sp.]
MPSVFMRASIAVFAAILLLPACGGGAEGRGGRAPGAVERNTGTDPVQPAVATGISLPEIRAADAGGTQAEYAGQQPLVAGKAGKAAAGPGAAAKKQGSAPPPAAGWSPLLHRLRNDPDAAGLDVWFQGLPPYSPQPMATKIKELFTSAFMRKRPPGDGKPRQPRQRIYRNVVTAENIDKCRNFLNAHAAVFDAVEKKYPVPREILVSLLFVETRLGVFTGKENAFWSLACMAAADSPERVKGGLAGIPLTSRHDAWLRARLKEKSEWAYKEMRALLRFCRDNGINPLTVPGSVYGAIGICQFMPTNLANFADDGDGNGVVDLFSEADAVFSAARYLTRHGWKAGSGVAGRRNVLKRYNNLNIYADTILTMAESLRTGRLMSEPPAN